MTKYIRLVALGLAAGTATPALAQTTLRLEAADNATVQAAGPRSGVNGKRFFNVQGSANGGFRSFGVADFLPAPTSGADITALRLEIAQSNASFTRSGPFSVYLTDATGVDIQPGSPVAYQGSGDGVGVVDPAFTNLAFLGTLSFSAASSGVVDTYDLSGELDANEEADLLLAIRAGSRVRLVLVPEAPTVSATFAGQDNFNGDAPTLVVDLDGGANALPPIRAEANDNATVQPGGPRSGVNGKRFFNIEGSANGAFASFGVADFVVRGVNATDILSLRLELAQSNASFTRDGTFSIYLTDATAVSIQPGSPIRYQSGNDGLASVDPAFTSLALLGQFTFTEVQSGTVDTFDLGPNLDPGEETALLGAINAGSTVRLVFVPDEPAVAATYAGQDNFNGDAPTLVFGLVGTVVPGANAVPRTIPELQGAGHFSPDVGVEVRTRGIVTAVGTFDAVGRTDPAGFFLQDPMGDGDLSTSDAVFVVSTDAVTVGDEVEVVGVVEESGFSGELPFTRIVADFSTVLSTGNPLPAPVLLGAGGRVPPSEEIDDDALASFDPTSDGLDFFESLESMRVTVQDALAVSPTNRFGEIFTVVDGGQSATGLSLRGTLNISPDDFNPEKIQIDPGRAASDPANFALPFVDTGATLGNVTGIVGYDFGNFQVQPEGPVTATSSTIAPEVTALEPTPNGLLVASYNVLNLDPNEGDGDTDIAAGRFDAIARQILVNMGKPDVIGLQEIQDNSGGMDDGVVAADQTLSTLVQAIVDAGGPSYAFIDNTFITNNNSGGQPGANIRTAFLYNPLRVSLVPGSVRTVSDVAAFTGARLPLIATFQFGSEEITVVNNHFSSKGGSAPIFGLEQPFEDRQEDVTVNGSLDERLRQSAAVRSFVDGVLTADPEARLVVLGDLNEFEFVSPVSVNLGSVLENLTLRLAENERYTFNFQGNSQSLDHILVSPSLGPSVTFDAVLVNSEFAETSARASDHDPLVALIDFTPICQGKRATVFVGVSGKVFGGPLDGRPYRGVLVGTLRGDVIAGTSGPDQLVGITGGDLMCGFDGNDRLLGGFGADTLDGGFGTDLCRGGLGPDTLVDCER